MPETTICHGIDGRLYEKLERLAKAAGMSPDEYAAKLGAERFFEKRTFQSSAISATVCFRFAIGEF